MRISGKKYAITGASRGLGATLAIVMADAGVQLVLLARTKEALQDTAKTIHQRTGQQVDTLSCDLANAESCIAAGENLISNHADLDGLIHNGAMWLAGTMDNVSDHDIQNCISSAVIGSLILTRHLLPNLKQRDNADIHTVISTNGIPNQPLNGSSIVFCAAKSAQAGFVQGLTEELQNTPIRVTAIYPGNIADISPTEAAWDQSPKSTQALSNREVVDGIMFILNMPPSVAIKSLVIQ